MRGSGHRGTGSGLIARSIRRASTMPRYVRHPVIYFLRLIPPLLSVAAFTCRGVRAVPGSAARRRSRRAVPPSGRFSVRTSGAALVTGDENPLSSLPTLGVTSSVKFERSGSVRLPATRVSSTSRRIIVTCSPIKPNSVSRHEGSSRTDGSTGLRVLPSFHMEEETPDKILSSLVLNHR